MRAIVLASLALSAAATLPPYVQFVNGLIYGMEPTLGGQLAPCVADSDTGMLDAVSGLALIDTGLTHRNLTAIYSGLTFMETALMSTRDAASACNAPEFAADIDKLLTDLGSDPFGTFARLVPHMDAVYTDLRAAVSFYRAANYTGSGYNVGLVFGIIVANGASVRVVGKIGQTTNTSYVEFLNGILIAVEPSVAGNISQCIPPTDAGAQDMDQAVQELEQALVNQSISALLEAYADFNTGLAVLRTASAACGEQEAAADFARISNDLETDPLGVAARLFPYMPTVFEDVSAGITAYKAQQYQQAGQDLGAVLAIILTTA